MEQIPPSRSVLHRHLRVLESFDVRHPFLTLSEIAAAADLPISTTHRLVGELEQEGLLERLPDRSYRLGVRLWEFASRTPRALGLREIARPWLEAVHSQVKQHTQLGVRSGRAVLFIERMSTPEAVINATLIGGRIPLYASSSGLVLLAHADDSTVADIAEHVPADFPDPHMRTESGMRERLRKIREDGHAVAAGYIHPESRGIAVPVPDMDGVYAAIGVVVANDASSPNAHIAVLHRAAAGIARDLAQAYRPDIDDRVHGLRPQIGRSRRSLEYLEGLSSDLSPR